MATSRSTCPRHDGPDLTDNARSDRGDAAAREVIVIAGLGSQAQWYRNLLARPAIEVAIGRQHYTPIHRELSEPEAVPVLAEYERRNRLVAPTVRRVLSWLVGRRYDGTETARRQLVSDLPVIRLRPADAPTSTTTGTAHPVAVDTLAGVCARSGSIRR